MFHLVGVQHDVQSIGTDGVETSDHAELRGCLENAINTHTPIAIAEEYNSEAIESATYRKKSPQEAFTPKVATKAGIRHLFCEPDIPTKKNFGYQGELSWLRLIDGLWQTVRNQSEAFSPGRYT